MLQPHIYMGPVLGWETQAEVPWGQNTQVKIGGSC